MPNSVFAKRQVSSLSVEELTELIRQTIRSELSELLQAPAENDRGELFAAPPPVRDIDTVITRMQASGKYNKKFLASLRKGMERSLAFQKPIP